MRICNVCCNTMTASSSLKGRVSCNKCDYDVCRDCTQKYISENCHDPKCMNCRSQWNEGFMKEILQKKFMKGEYQKKKTDLAFKREMSSLKSVMHIASHKRKEHILKDKLKAAQVVLHTLLRERVKFLWSFCKEVIKLDESIEKQKNEIEKTKQEIRLFNKRKIKNFVFGKRCILNDCKNGIVDSTGVCLGCDRKICPQCYQEECVGHVCKQDDMKTAELIHNNSKACPGCASLISKIDGCDQMFCVNCHTAFSWSKGSIETGKVHNPHYYEYLRKKEKYIPDGDINTCGLLNYDIIPFVVRRANMKTAEAIINLHRTDLRSEFDVKTNRTCIKKILKFYVRSLENIINYELPYWNARAENNNDDLKVKYLLHKVNEEQYKKQLNHRDKIMKVSREVCTVMDNFRIVFEERVKYIWHLENLESLHIIRIIDEIKELRNNMNVTFKNISREKKVHVPYLTNWFSMYSMKPDGQIYGEFRDGEF